MPESEVDRSSAVAAALVGGWTNQFGSQLLIESAGDDRFRGTYRLADARRGPRPVAGTFAAAAEGGRAAVGFHVSWPDSASVTVWCGEYDPAEGAIDTSWLMTTEPDGGAHPRWRPTLLGHDRFGRSPEV